MIKEQIYEVLGEIVEDIELSDETLLLDDGILDSISILYLVSELESKNKINIPLENITEDNFRTIDNIEKFVNTLIGDKI